LSYAELLKADVKRIDDKLTALKAEQGLIEKVVNELEEKILAIEVQKAFHIKEKDLLQLTSRDIRTKVYAEIEKVVTHYLQFVFEQPDLEFKIEPVYYERRTELRFWTTKSVVDESGEVKRYLVNPIESRGGGLVNVLTFALYLAVDLWLEPPCEGPWLLDEIFKNVSERYIPKCIELLTLVSSKYKRQSISVTHNNQMTKWCDNIYEVSLKPDGFSEVKKI
jgi:hypothetical protein